MNRKYMAKTLLWMLAAFVLLLGITACDDDKPTVTTDNMGVVSGTVYSAGRAAIPDVSVSIGNLTTTTNSEGQFTLLGVTPGTNVKVDFMKAGLISNQKVVTVTKGKTTFVTSAMFAPSTQTFAATSDASVVDGMGSIMLPANSFVDSQGNAFTGTVLSEVKYFDPTYLENLDAFPGNFVGVQTNGTETMFESFGFISANFFDAANPTSALNLGPGKTAQIMAMIPSQLADNAPETIPMWYYDETTGKWMEQGSATKVGSYYSGNVSHFTYWNFDHPIIPEAQSTLTGRVMTADRGVPVAGAQVVATGVNYAGYNRVYSDVDGNFSIIVKASAMCRLQAFSGVNSSASSAVINTPAAGGSMATGDLIIEDLSFTITGVLKDTSGNPITAGHGMIFQVNPPAGTNPFQAWIMVNENGEFSTTAVNTSGATNLTVQVQIFQRNNLYSNAITFASPTPGTIKNLGNVTMRPGGNIKGRVRISGGSYLNSGYIYFNQEGSQGEGTHFSGSIDEDGYFTISGPPSTTLNNMRGSVYAEQVNYQTSLMSLSFPASGGLNNIGTVTVSPGGE